MPVPIRRARAVAHNLPVTASVLARHVGQDRWKAVSVLWRGAPPSVRRAALRAATRSPLRVTTALGLAADGRRDAARALLADVIDTGTPAELRRASAAAATLGDTAAAARALARLPAADPERARLTALLDLAEGRLGEADATLAGVPGRPAARLRARLADERAGLDGHGLPAPRAGVGPRRGGPVTRVLHVVTNALPEVEAGYTLRTQGIAAAQRAAGLDAHVVTRVGFPVDSGSVGAGPEAVVDGVPYHRLLPRRPLPAGAGPRLDLGVEELGRLCDRLRPDLLHAHSKHDNAQVALRVARRLDVPVVYEVRGFLEETWLSRGRSRETDHYRMTRATESSCMAGADAVVTLSRSMRDAILDRGIDPDRVHLVPNAVDDTFLGPVPDPGPTRRALGIGDGDTVFAVVSTLNDYEGVDTLLRAAHRLDDPGVVVLVVGSGPAADDLRGLAAELGVRAVLPGRVPHADVRRFHAAADVFCVPRRRTPVTSVVPPLKPLEAMATGRPVLLSDLPPLVELLDGGDVGLLATPDDPAAWAEAMSALLYDPTGRRRRGRLARDWVAGHRTWSTAAERYADVYRSVTSTVPDQVEENTQ